MSPANVSPAAVSPAAVSPDAVSPAAAEEVLVPLAVMVGGCRSVAVAPADGEASGWGLGGSN